MLIRARIHFDFATAEHFRFGSELAVDFKTDHWIILGHSKNSKNFVFAENLIKSEARQTILRKFGAIF
jgi:hypothetical protein